jgi:hypothetical protein
MATRDFREAFRDLSVEVAERMEEVYLAMGAVIAVLVEHGVALRAACRAMEEMAPLVVGLLEEVRAQEEAERGRVSDGDSEGANR